MGRPHCWARHLRGVAANLQSRAERRRATGVQSLEHARLGLTALAQRAERQRIAELQSLEDARSGLRQLAERVERPREVATQSLKRAQSHLAELSQRVRQQRTAQIAALRALAGARPELDKLCRLGASEPQRELDFLEVLGVHHSEEAHSNVLRWLLDPDETHRRDSAFLSRFMTRTAGVAEERDMAGIAPSRMQGADWSDVEVLREWNFIDILVLNQRERIVCAIENKIGAAEGFNDQGVSQLTRYRELIEEEFPHHERHFVFLTPSGRPSRVRHEQQFWIPESYTAIQQAVKDLLEENDGAERSAALFALAQYETTLRRNNRDIGERSERARTAHLPGKPDSHRAGLSTQAGL